ncbi:hypothetical protein CNX65_08615 [Actinosynnema pretiosum]|uniref:Uncharacterized protein n=1 Tax=Actinosynnema pretiosum TaxID=42197 RepID=A0A290Z2S2_9PSEU|nr:hypothetical protein CNX65_08615 [Actinosynnema pretiosum]
MPCPSPCCPLPCCPLPCCPPGNCPCPPPSCPPGNPLCPPRSVIASAVDLPSLPAVDTTVTLSPTARSSSPEPPPSWFRAPDPADSTLNTVSASTT